MKQFCRIQTKCVCFDWRRVCHFLSFSSFFAILCVIFLINNKKKTEFADLLRNYFSRFLLLRFIFSLFVLFTPSFYCTEGGKHNFDDVNKFEIKKGTFLWTIWKYVCVVREMLFPVIALKRSLVRCWNIMRKVKKSVFGICVRFNVWQR